MTRTMSTFFFATNPSKSRTRVLMTRPLTLAPPPKPVLITGSASKWRSLPLTGLDALKRTVSTNSSTASINRSIRL